MNLNAEKERIKNEIDATNDEHLLKAIKEMLGYAKAKNEDRYLKPFTKQQLIKRAINSEKDIKAGRTTSIKDLRREIIVNNA
jgi:hypothetical protein